jgi:HK97 family phage major capsid protein
MKSIAQLETDLRAKKQQASALLETTMRAAADHVVKPATATEPEQRGRLMTDTEKQAIDALLAEGKEIKAQLDRAQGDASLAAAIDGLTSGMATRPAPEREPRRGAAALSLGQQFVAAEHYREWIKSGQHRRQGSLSPSIACEDVLDFRGTTLSEGAGSGGALVTPDIQPGIVPLLFRRLVVADLIAPGTTTSNLVQYMKETTFTNAAAAVLEGGLKPESALVFASATSPVQKIAHWIPVTEEMLEDYAQTQSIVDSRLRLGLALTEEDELLNGSGVAPHLLGLTNLPGLSPAIARGTDSNADALFKQITAIATTVFVTPDGIILNPINWQSIQLTKNAAGNYLGSGPWAAPSTPMLWGLPVAVTPAEAAGVGFVGGFRSSAQIFRRAGVRVEASNSHASFFINNLVAIRAEERLALAAYREAAFGKVTGLA